MSSICKTAAAGIGRPTASRRATTRRTTYAFARATPAWAARCTTPNATTRRSCTSCGINSATLRLRPLDSLRPPVERRVAHRAQGRHVQEAFFGGRLQFAGGDAAGETLEHFGVLIGGGKA